MLTYVLRRLVATLPVLLVISIGTFALMSLILGDPVLLILGQDAAVDEATIERMRTELGLNRPLPIQYLDWLRHVVVGDFGRSVRSPVPVSEAVLSRLPVTFQLTAMALSLAIIVALPLGIVAALRPGSRFDLGVSGLAVVGLSIPNFWLGILLIFLFALKLRWLPSAGYVPFTEDPLQNLKLMILPSLTLAAAYVGTLIRYTRSVMVDVLSQDYMQTARAKGLGRFTVVGRHAFRNGLIPIVTVISLELAGLFGGAVVTETVFSLPGVGTLLIRSILGRDLPVVQGVVMFVAVAVVFTNLIADVAYAYLDPRVRSLYG
ncbi:MAG: ABC transporter permease [Thermomicrobiales bacterium]